VGGAEDTFTCDLCGMVVRDVNSGKDGLSLEVERWPEGGNPDYVHAMFCTQAHAAEWLTRPLPEPEPEPSTAVAVDRGERTFWAGFIFCLAWAVALMALGAYALVRLLGGWDQSSAWRNLGFG
jgi:hypothetical protein